MVSLDTIFDLLRKERRRYALYYLENQEEPVSVDELAETIARWESDPAEAGIPGEKYERVRLSLCHTHLPKTAGVDFIEYVPEKGVVNVHGTPSEFDAVLTVAEVFEEPKASG